MKGRSDGQIREVINRNTLISLALGQGYNVFLPVYDAGIDFIFYREKDQEIRKVQLKSRWTIDVKYQKRDIWIAFPINAQWYLMRHDDMVAVADKQGFTKTQSWKKGTYTLPKPSKSILESCELFSFSSIALVADKAAIETEKN